MPKQDGITLPMVSMEGLTDIDADHIVVIATEADKKDLENSAIWAQIRAVKDGNVTILDAAPFFSQSYNPIGKELLNRKSDLWLLTFLPEYNVPVASVIPPNLLL